MYGWHLAELIKLDYPRLKTLYMARYLQSDSPNSALSVHDDFFVFRALQPMFNVSAPAENLTVNSKNISVIGETIEIDTERHHTRSVWSKYALSET